MTRTVAHLSGEQRFPVPTLFVQPGCHLIGPLLRHNVPAMTDTVKTAPETLIEEVTALLQRAQTAEAVELARDILNRGIETPLLLNLRAFWLEGQNRAAEALADLQRAHQLTPSDPMVLNALGLCFAKLGRMGEALAAFRRCAELAPEFGPAHYNCGWTLEELGELDSARDAFNEAARLNPSAADPLGRLAALAARRGQWEATRAFAQKALSLAPNNPAATIALAGAEIAQRDYISARDRLQALIDSKQLSAQDSATATNLLGDVADAEGRYRVAFADYAASNAMFKTAFAERLAARAEMPMSDYVGWLLESFENPGMSSWQKDERSNSHGGDGPSCHLFVLGFPRSGTTLLEEVLACHADAVTTGERDALAEAARELLASPEQMTNLRLLGSAAIRRYRRRYYEALQAFGIDARKKILVDKQPLNSIRLPLIARLFPEAKIAFCLRDPRDVVLSCFRRRFTPNAANAEFLTLDGTARLYDMVMRLVAAYRKKLALSVHEIKNEDLVREFDAQVRALCAFANIEWTAEFREFANRSRTRQVATPSAPQISRGLASDGIGHWRNYEIDLAPVLPLLKGWVERFGYEDAQAQQS